MKLKLLISLFSLISTSIFANSFQVTGDDAIKLVEKMQKTKLITFDGHAMGKTYFAVNQSLCLFSGDSRVLSCNDVKVSSKEMAEEDLENMVQLSVLTYDGAAMGGKTYFRNEAQFCSLSTVSDKKTNEEVAALNCQ